MDRTGKIRGSDRRTFLGRSLSCAGWLVAGLALAPAAVRRSFAAQARAEVVAEEDFARIEKLAEGVWAIVSTPLKDGGRHFTTTSNGGIIAGKRGVLAIEGFYSEEGGKWLAEQARKLTGRDVTHSVVTHYHADHTRGLGGLASARLEKSKLRMLSTATTRKRLSTDEEQTLLPEAQINEKGKPTRIDLGGRVVDLVPRKGHTSSDVTIELREPHVIWCGDLVWNHMFPNYVDAVPSHLTRNCEEILAKQAPIYVPGHGDLADADDLTSYVAMIGDVGRAAQLAFEKGTPAAAAAAEYAVPESLGEWFMFSPNYFERAFAAWEKELAADSGEAPS